VDDSKKLESCIKQLYDSVIRITILPIVQIGRRLIKKSIFNATIAAKFLGYTSTRRNNSITIDSAESKPENNMQYPKLLRT